MGSSLFPLCAGLIKMDNFALRMLLNMHVCVTGINLEIEHLGKFYGRT